MGEKTVFTERVEVCENCKHGEQVELDTKDVSQKRAFQCRRYPPRVVMLKQPAEWPILLPKAWCGEFVFGDVQKKLLS